jgi:hypothetical protein
MNNVYGYCPRCGGLGMSRERRLNGNDRCENGHSYPSSTAVTNPLLPVAPATEHTADTERAAIVRWLNGLAKEGLALAIERGGARREGDK